MQSSHETMDSQGRQDASWPLHEELIEKIVVMLPFPEIFNVRLLSKSWLARFQPISSLNDEEEKLRAIGFQKQVREWSRTWGSFYPVCTDEDNLFGYDRRSQIWQRLASLCFLPKNLIGVGHGPFPSRRILSAHKNLHLHGAFLYGSSDPLHDSSRLFVANIVTQTWRNLPPHLTCDFSTSIVNDIQLVTDASSDTYKLILSCQELRKNFPHFAQIYDSKSGTWSRVNFVNSVGLSWAPTTFAYLKGVLYGISMNNLRSITAFNVEEGTMEERIMPSTLNTHIRSLTLTNFIIPLGEVFDILKLMVFNGRLMLILNGFQNRSLTLFEIDVKSLQWREVADCHFDDLEVDIIDIHVSEDNSMFVELGPNEDELDGAMVVYDKDEDKWRFFHFTKEDYDWSACSFEPGLNPFMEV